MEQQRAAAVFEARPTMKERLDDDDNGGLPVVDELFNHDSTVKGGWDVADSHEAPVEAQEALRRWYRQELQGRYGHELDEALEGIAAGPWPEPTPAQAAPSPWPPWLVSRGVEIDSVVTRAGNPDRRFVVAAITQEDGHQQVVCRDIETGGLYRIPHGDLVLADARRPEEDGVAAAAATTVSSDLWSDFGAWQLGYAGAAGVCGWWC